MKEYFLIPLLFFQPVNSCNADVLRTKYYGYYRNIFVMWEEYKREHGKIDDQIKKQIKKYLMHQNNAIAGRLIDELEEHNYDLETFEIKK